MNYSLLTDEQLAAISRDDDDAMQELTKRYMLIARYVAMQYPKAPLEQEDLIQEAMLAFIPAVYSYDESRKCSFEVYAKSCMKNRILSLLRALSSKKRVPADMMVPLKEQQSSISVPSPEDAVLEDSAFEYFSALISRSLTKKEDEVFRLHLTGYTYEEIASRLSSSPKAVDSTLQRARKKLRENSALYKNLPHSSK